MAIELFRKKFSVKNHGLNVKLKKNIPIGAGLGGGSSNAATTLIALAKIWNIKITSNSLFDLGLELGSDVPFFLNGMNAWAEGRGEIITNIYLRPKWYLLIFSPYFISTKEIYELVNTENDEKKYDFDDFINDRVQNDFEKIVLKKYPSITKTKKLFSKYGKPRMTGTGGTFFIDFESAEKAEKVLLAIVANKPPSLPKNYKAIIVKSHNNDNID
jgi:4-diphosphocytidyl-2-C-methyl-D-erythritol kinase